MKGPIPKVTLHPASCKYLKLGHPWITADSYTKKFPPEAFFLLGIDEKSKQVQALLLSDPEHKTVKARLWSQRPSEWEEDFHEVLKRRMREAVAKRKDLFLERENIFLINGESDELPGLVVQRMKNELIIQYYALFWKREETFLLSFLKELLPDVQDIWVQSRNFERTKNVHSLQGREFSEFTLQEFGINYHIRINQHYDFGLYSDMSAIRKAMRPHLESKKSLLNLFSYTGAFSLYALSLGLSEVVSVDLSGKYLAWLEENIALNPALKKEHHTSLCMPTQKALEKFVHEAKKFEVIICDPPSASSDGQKMSNALKSYELLLPLMLKLLDQKSGKLFLFLNTHAISWNKFEEKLKEIIEHSAFKNQVMIVKRFKLAEDCLPLKGFSEGDYLKGFLIEFKPQK